MRVNLFDWDNKKNLEEFLILEIQKGAPDQNWINKV